MQRRRYTDAEQAALLRLRGEGLSLTDIAKGLGRTYASVAGQSHALQRHGGRVPPVHDPRRWTDDDDQLLVDLRDVGWTNAEICAALRISSATLVWRVALLRRRGHVVQYAPQPSCHASEARP